MSAPVLRPAVLYYCQHSVGLGHLVRTLAVAAALAERFRVVVLSGGLVPEGLAVPDGVELVPLPPVGADDGAGRHLASLDPSLDLAQAWSRRREVLLASVEQLHPAALVVELFPLGRRKFAHEVVPMLEAARDLRPRPAVVCSVRDILVANGPEQQGRDDEAASRLNALFDAVVVHSDPAMTRLEETFRPTVPLRTPVYYSGFVVPGRRLEDEPPGTSSDVVVSVGGGMVGGPLVRAAALAHSRHLQHLGMTTRIVVGPFANPPDVAAALGEAAECRGLRVERFVPDLLSVLRSAAVSVSQCGYNTSLDVVRAGVPAVVVPHDAGRETEQAERARRLAALGVVRVLPSSELTPARLAGEIVEAASSTPSAAQLDLGGAQASAEIVARSIAHVRATGAGITCPARALEST